MVRRPNWLYLVCCADRIICDQDAEVTDINAKCRERDNDEESETA